MLQTPDAGVEGGHRLRAARGRALLQQIIVEGCQRLQHRRGAIARLHDAGVEAVAICPLHAYRDPAHERALAGLCGRLLPGVPASCSSEVVPEITECERASTTCANVCVMPLMSLYLDDLE